MDVRGGEGGGGGDACQLDQEGDLRVEGTPRCVARQLLISLTLTDFSDASLTADDEWWK